jgi:hypothetical protein
MNSTTIPEKPPTFHGDLENLPEALLPLTERPIWVIWKKEWVKNKDGGGNWTKVPYQPRYYNQKAKSDDPKTWGTYAEAIHAFRLGHCDGLGFMLKDSGLGAIDVDHIRNFVTGEILHWAEVLLEEAAAAGCYCEWTVSGTGARIIGLAKDSELHRKITVHAANDCAIEFYRNTHRFITVSGLQIPGLPKTAALPEYDALFDEFYARFSDAKTRPAAKDCVLTGGAGEETPKPPVLSCNEYDLSDADPQPPGIQDLIEKGAPIGKRSEAFQKVVSALAAQGLTSEQIVEILAKHPAGIAEKYAGRLPAEVARSFSKAQQQAGGATNAAPSPVASPKPWPLIRIKAGELPRVVKEAEAALIALEAGIYQRGGMLVRPIKNVSLACGGRETESWQLIGLERAFLVEMLCHAARWERARILKNGFVDWIRVDAPDKVAETFLKRLGRWRLPHLAGVVNTPFMRADGSICEVAGYDASSRLLFEPGGEVFPQVPMNPSKNIAVAALAKLIGVIMTFPFVSKVDRSVALASMLTVLARRAMPTAPLFAYTAPAAGTGKSMLVDLANVLATGWPMPVISQGWDEGEFEKRLSEKLLAGDVCISIDNCEAPLGGALLNQALTQSEVGIRVLGSNRENVKVAMASTLFANGNNLVIAGDLTRRCLLGQLDAGVERPELREFSVDAVEEVIRMRPELVVAGLTVLRAWHIAYAGGERVVVEPFGSFAVWSRRVREALVWLGEKDPCESVEKVRENDPQRDSLEAVITGWLRVLGLNAYNAQEVINLALGVPDFYSALMAVAPAPRGSVISAVSLGRYLKRVQGKIVNGYSVLEAGITHGYRRWHVVKR